MKAENYLTTLLKIHQPNFYDIFGFPLSKENTIILDFTANNKDLTDDVLNNSAAQQQYINCVLHSKNENKIGVGGYNEERILYKNTKLFNKKENRNIHLGIDLWYDVDTKINAPIAGKIHSYKNNIGKGNYGPTIILEHQIEEVTFYTLYGHLSTKSLQNLTIGKTVNRGECFTSIGNYSENGNWATHLHFQIITDLLDNFGDFIGVCNENERTKYLNNCPDANLILKIPQL